MVAGPERLYDYMVETARFRDHLYFGSDATAASELGVSRRTVIRWRQQLESTGKIERCGWKRWGVGKRTVVYRFRHRRVTQRTSCRTPTLTGLRTSREERIFACERILRRLGLGQIELFNAGPPERPTAQHVVERVCDICAADGMPVLTRHKGIIGRQAREALEDGVELETVVAAGVIAVRRAQPQNLHFILADLIAAFAGRRMTRKQYEQELQDEMELRGK